MEFTLMTGDDTVCTHWTVDRVHSASQKVAVSGDPRSYLVADERIRRAISNLLWPLQKG